MRWLLPFAFLLVAGTGAGIWWYLHPEVSRVPGVVYGERGGRPLTMEILRPGRPNGAGVILLVSGSWKSNTNAVAAPLVAPLLRRGYTVFAVSHHSQPACLVQEIAEDIHRAVRAVRHQARAYGVDPLRLGVTGGSSGGHLSLLIATRGGPGDPAAGDPVDRESSAVQSVACFFPATDLLDLGTSTENPGDGGPPRSYRAAFGEGATNAVAWQRIGRELSPLYHVTAGMPPVLLYHGDADTLVPLEQSERLVRRADEVGARVKLVVRQGKGHGWPEMLRDIRQFADWFDATLPP